MRRARINYPESYNHVMSRGHEGKMIFEDAVCKESFLQLLQHYSYRNNIIILGWCIMNNHFHLVLYNKSGQLSKFMKELNGTYGTWYRTNYGGRGVVFDGRFKSTVIENEKYLLNSLLYLYNNPVRAGIVTKAENYFWSSLRELLLSINDPITDISFLNNLLGEKNLIYELLKKGNITKNKIFKDNWGETLGNNVFRFHALTKNNRRKEDKSVNQRRRKKERISEKPGIIIQKFMEENNVTLEELSSRTQNGVILRDKLILLLRDEYGLKLKEIHNLSPYRHLSLSSMGKLYHNAKKKLLKS